MIERLAMLLLAASPSSETRAAAADLLLSVAPADRPFVRYLSLYAIDADRRADAERAGRFWTNSLSRRAPLAPLRKRGASLLRLDVRDFDWPPEAWESLTALDPYFRQPWLDRSAEEYLRGETRSSGAILRLDWFLAQTSTEPMYSRFLGLPASRAELLRSLGIDGGSERDSERTRSAVVLRSIVARHNRRLDRTPLAGGYLWQTVDVRAHGPGRFALEALDGLNADAGEIFWSLPNGLQGYFLVDGRGEQVDAAPAEIARDPRSPLGDPVVRSPRSCVGCHAEGVRGFTNAVADLLDLGFRIESPEERASAAARARIGQRLGVIVDADQRHYASAVRRVNGLDPRENAQRFERLLADYLETPIHRGRAARELGIDDEAMDRVLEQTTTSTLRLFASRDPRFAGLPRDAWEALFAEAALLARTIEEESR